MPQGGVKRAAGKSPLVTKNTKVTKKASMFSYYFNSSNQYLEGSKAKKTLKDKDLAKKV
jgi:hypothetical protein